jgi:flagellar motor switch protein FliG
MNLSYFICSLNEENREMFYKKVVEGQRLSDDEWEKVMQDISQYREFCDGSCSVDELLETLSDREKNKLLSAIKAAGKESFYLRKLHSFEDISSVQRELVERVLKTVPEETIICACVGTSPDNRDYLTSAYEDSTIQMEIMNHKTVSLAEIEKAQRHILEEFNKVI